MKAITVNEMRSIDGGKTKYIYCTGCGLVICKKSSLLAWMYKLSHRCNTNVYSFADCYL